MPVLLVGQRQHDRKGHEHALSFIMMTNPSLKDPWFEDLQSTDHLWLLENFIKTSASAFFHDAVVTILRRYLCQAPLKINVDQAQRRFVSTASGEIIFVSLSHSKNFLLLGLSRRAALGVDIEVVAHRARYQTIARRYFPHESIANLREFLLAWTAREAFVKALGCGINRQFASITTRHYAHGLVIGFNEIFSHEVVHVHLNQAIAGICRPMGAQNLRMLCHQHQNRVNEFASPYIF